MNRKEELEVLIVHANSKVEKNLDEQESILKKFADKIKNALIDLGVDPSFIKSIRVSDEYSYVTVIGPNGKDGEMTIHHKTSWREFSLGWFSSGASDTDESIHKLIYLEVLGIIARDTRTTKVIEGLTAEFQLEFAPIRQEFYKLSNDRDSLKRELYDINEDELDKVIIDLGKLTFPEPIREYVKNSDNYRTTFDSVEIKSSTNAFFFLSFKEEGVDKGEKKMKKYDALRFLRKIYKEYLKEDEGQEAA